MVLKERKWKNKNGSGSKLSYGLSAHDFIDGRSTLTQLQTDFYEYAKQWDLKNNLYRGLSAEKQTKVYTEKTNHLLGELRELNRQMYALFENISNGIDTTKSKEELEKKKIEYDRKNKEIVENQEALAKAEKELKVKKNRNKNGGWKKGLDFFT